MQRIAFKYELIRGVLTPEEVKSLRSMNPHSALRGLLQSSTKKEFSYGHQLIIPRHAHIG